MDPLESDLLVTGVRDVTETPLGHADPDATEDNVDRAAPGDRANLPAAFFQSAV
jgi:hypothetical protein